MKKAGRFARSALRLPRKCNATSYGYIDCCETPEGGSVGVVKNMSITCEVTLSMEADGIAVPRNTGACVCGPKDMFVAVKELLTKAGVFESRVLSNF